MKRIGADDENISIEKYRIFTGDYKSTDERVQSRIDYIYSLMRNIIRAELDRHKSERISQKSDNIALKTESQNDL